MLIGSPSGPKRRSTRILRAVPLTVKGVDSARAPYAEQVSTVEISSHGCKYNSRYDVFQGQHVTLQMGHNEYEEPACSVGGVVKWVQRPSAAREPFRVAVELEVPGNVWGIELPPKDWLPLPEPKVVELPTAERSTVAQTAPLATGRRSDDGPALLPDSLGTQAAAPLSPLIARLTSEFGEQIQRIISEAAAAAAVGETSRLLAESRTQLDDEVKKVVQGLVASHTDRWLRWMTQQMNQALQATAKTLHEQWTRKLELDLRQASERLAARNAELNHQALELATKGLQEKTEEISRLFTHKLDGYSRSHLEHMSKLIAELALKIGNITVH